ncbi:hypothetical protein ACFL4M_00805 [Pseudomonadota bacterium]
MAELQVLFVFIIGPILINVFFISVASAINFIPSFYIAERLSLKIPFFRKTIFLLLFLTLVFVFHLNYRIPGIIYDLQNSPETIEIVEPISIHVGDTVSVEINHETVSYKAKYLESTSAAFGYGFSRVKINTDYFISNLENLGVRISRDEDAAVKIIGSIEQTASHHKINLRVQKNGKVIAKYFNVFRVSFAGEQSKSFLTNFLLASLQSTPTRLLFPDFWKESMPTHTVTDFLNDVFQVVPRTETTPVTLATVTSYDKKPNDYIMTNEELNVRKEGCIQGSKRISIDRRYVVNKSNPRKRTQAGRWVNIFEGHKPIFKKYFQAPGMTIYHGEIIHQTICSDKYFTVMASFMGSGMSREQWLALFKRKKIKTITINSTSEERKEYFDESNRINSMLEKMRKTESRNIWLLKYDYNGTQKEALNFIMPKDTPENIDSILRKNEDKWIITGFDIEIRREDRKSNRYKISDYSIIISTE